MFEKSPISAQLSRDWRRRRMERATEVGFWEDIWEWDVEKRMSRMRKREEEEGRGGLLYRKLVSEEGQGMVATERLLVNDCR